MDAKFLRTLHEGQVVFVLTGPPPASAQSKLHALGPPVVAVVIVAVVIVVKIVIVFFVIVLIIVVAVIIVVINVVLLVIQPEIATRPARWVIEVIALIGVIAVIEDRSIVDVVILIGIDVKGGDLAKGVEEGVVIGDKGIGDLVVGRDDCRVVLPTTDSRQFQVSL